MASMSMTMYRRTAPIPALRAIRASDQAEWLLPTSSTASIPLITPDLRFRYVRPNRLGLLTPLRIIKLELDAVGLPKVPKVRRRRPKHLRLVHDAEPRTAYVHVSNDDEPMWPQLSMTMAARALLAASAVTAIVTTGIAALGAWVLTW